MKTTKLEISQSRFPIKHTDMEEVLSELMVSHIENYTTVVGPFDLEDLKLLRKLIRKEIKRIQDENN